jgi:transposase InsO family protein
LPEETRTYLAARGVSAQLESEAGAAGTLAARKVALIERVQGKAREVAQERSLARALTLSDRATERVDAKLAVLAAFEAFQAAAALPRTRALHTFAAEYSAGRISVNGARHEIPDVSPATLHRWHIQLREGGITALAGAYGNRRGSGKVDSQREVHDFLVAMLVDHPHASAKHLSKGLYARFKDRPDVRLPRPRSLQRWVRRWKRENAQVFEAVRNPDAWKSRYMTAQGSASEGIERLNQRWELDSTPGDVMLTDGRHSVIGAIDVWPRRAKLLVAKTSKAAAIATLVRHALLDWGVPEQAKTDQGQDYTSKHVVRVFEGLGVEHILCPPFQPWRKPHIERFFRTFAHDLVELLGGFIGHNVAERKAIEERSAFCERLFQKDGLLEVKLSSSEFQRFCDEWCENVYMHQAHEGLGGKTPFERVAAWTGEVRRIEDVRALDVLLAEAPANEGLRTVQKKGIELDGTHFIAPELGPRVGEQVRVRFDPADLGRIYVFDLAGEFVCVAEAPERTGIDRREVAAKAQALQRTCVQEARRELKASARKLKTADIVNEILAERAEAAGKLARLPSASNLLHASAGLAQAAEAARSRRGPERTISQAEIAAARARLEQAKPAATVTAIPETPRQRYQRWCSLDRQAQLGAQLTPEERDFHELYAQSDEFRSQRRAAFAAKEDRAAEA